MSDVEMVEHIAGRPVSRSTYQRYGCRCAGCRAAATAKHAEMRRRAGGALRADRIYRRAQTKALVFMRREMPDVWRRLLDEARAELESVEEVDG